jgi:SCP-2 sterol transfer family
MSGVLPGYARAVAVFSSERDLYAALGRMFEELVGDPLLVPHLQRADTVVQYRFSGPQATITVDVRADGEASAEFGPGAAAEPEIVLSMDGDTAHRLFLGEVNLTVAVARRQIRAEGPMGKVLKLVPLLRPSTAIYRALCASGREPVTA